MKVKLKHFPDKPWEQDPRYLPEWDASNNYSEEQKIDGWRMMLVITEDDIRFISRHDKDHTKDVEPEIQKAALELRKHFTPQTQIDAEWLSRRSCSLEYRLPPKLFLLDILRCNNEWLLAKTYAERHKIIEEVMPLLTNHDIIDMPPSAKPGEFVSFYEAQKTIPFSEGVVIKHKNSKLVASRTECAKNPLWFKVKYRGASSDGEMRMDHLRSKL